jgi:hypothetical protein
MPMRPARLRIARNLLLATALSLGAAGCESGLDIFDKLDFFTPEKKPVPGERRAVFPAGIPGIEYNAPPAQPTNANVPLSMAPQTPAPTPEATPGKPANPRASRTAQQPKSSGDPWDGTR